METESVKLKNVALAKNWALERVALLVASISFVFAVLGGLFATKVSLGSEFWAAISGAVVGGVISAAIQGYASWREHIIREKERNVHREALARSLLAKAYKVYGDLIRFSHYLEEEFKNAPKEFLDSPVSFVRPVSFIPQPVVFSDNELDVIFDIEEINLYQSVLTIHEAHHSGIVKFKLYNDSRNILFDGIDIDSVGDVVMFNISEDRRNKFNQQSLEINNLIHKFRMELKIQIIETKKTIDRIGVHYANSQIKIRPL